MLSNRLFCILAIQLLICTDALAQYRCPDISQPATTVVYPDRYIRNGQTHFSEAPHVTALRSSVPGEIIELREDASGRGEYTHFTIGLNGWDQVRDAHRAGGFHDVTMRGARGQQIIIGRDNESDALSLVNGSEWGPNRRLCFQNLTFILVQRTGIIFYQNPGTQRYQDIHFDQITIRPNELNPHFGQRRWGMRLYSTNGFWITNSTIQDVREEHSIYGTDLGGFTFIHRNRFLHSGRNALQIRDDPNYMSGPAPGNVVFSENYVENMGQLDGASSVTIAGGERTNVYIRKNVMVNGFTVPQSNGAITAWTESPYGYPYRVRCVQIEENVIVYNNGDRDLLMLSAIGKLMVRNNLLISTNRTAVSLNYGGGAPIGAIYLQGNQFERANYHSFIDVMLSGIALSQNQTRLLDPGPNFSWDCR